MGPRARLTGLSTAEAAERLRTVGPNVMPAAGGRSLGRIMLETGREPMFGLLLGAAGIYLVLGDLGEGLFLLAGAVASIGLVIFQEARSERALSALRELAQPTVRVIRDSVEAPLPATALVPGDIVLVGEGERLSSDGVLISGDVLGVDESTLTGESAPVSKSPASAAEDSEADAVPGREGGPHLFAGTLVVRGQGVVQVTRTGPRSALGRIGASLQAIGFEQTPLQKAAGRLVGVLGLLALGFCAAVTAAYGLLRGGWVEAALAGITVAIALIPEEFPMVLAVFLAIGAWRLASHKVLVRRGAVIETLGGATVLCVDKTGTLTENNMRIERLWTEDGDWAAGAGRDPDGAAAALIRYASLASAVHPIDPMDKAVRALWAAGGAPGLPGAPERTWPLRPERLAMVQLWVSGSDRRLAAAKGAPEAVFKLCRLTEAETTRLHGVVETYAEEGLRVLGVAWADTKGEVPETLEAVTFRFAGLLGFLDPLRAEVPAALEEAKGAGVKVVMITGDHPATALAIARQAGIATEAGVLTGAELAAMSPETMQAALRTTRVFARVPPEQKLRIVQALRADGEVVAMTGDGVNDAPALEAAHIGVAMGRKGTDVAREAADLILLDDSFASIVGGVRLGRRIFANLRGALTYITAIHVPIAGLALAPVLLGLPPLLMPMHVVLLELVIDPTSALVFEAQPSEATAMRRPPRRSNEALFGTRQIGFAVLQGSVVLAGVLGLYAWMLATGEGSEGQARGAAFLALVVSNLAVALTGSTVSGRLFAASGRVFWIIASMVGLAMTLVLSAPPVSAVFDVAPPSPGLLLLAFAVGVIGGGWTALAEPLKGARGRR